MTHTQNLFRQTAELHSLISGLEHVADHPKGHTKKLLRYRSTCGAEIAVEKRQGVPLLYFSRTVAGNRLDTLLPEWVEAGTTGRNSNLNSMETFKNKALARLRVTTLDTARKALDACVSK